MFVRGVVDAAGQPADGSLFSEATKRHPHRTGVLFHAGKVIRSEDPTLTVAVYRVKYLTDRAMWFFCHGIMLKKQGSFFTLITRLPDSLATNDSASLCAFLRFVSIFLRVRYQKLRDVLFAGEGAGWFSGRWLGECRRSFAHRSLRCFATARAAPNAASAYLGSSPAPAPRFSAYRQLQNLGNCSHSLGFCKSSALTRVSAGGRRVRHGGCRGACRSGGSRGSGFAGGAFRDAPALRGCGRLRGGAAACKPRRAASTNRRNQTPCA